MHSLLPVPYIRLQRFRTKKLQFQSYRSSYVRGRVINAGNKPSDRAELVITNISEQDISSAQRQTKASRMTARFARRTMREAGSFLNALSEDLTPRFRRVRPRKIFSK